MSNYTGTSSRRRLKIGLAVLLALLLLLAGGLTIAGNYFFDVALNPNSDIAFAQANGISDGPDTQWLLGAARDVYLDSEDGLKLHAYRVDQPENTHKYAIVCHGYQNNATGSPITVRHLYDLGFTTIAPNARGHGESEGDYIGMGWPERRDIVGWCKSIVAEDPNAQIMLMGVSMGGATVMMTTGEADLPSNVRCAVEDCGYTSAWDEFAGQLKDLYGLPAFPLLDVTNLVTQVRAGYDIKEASAVEQVKKSVTPTLFIHGEADTFVPYWMLDVVYNAAACEKERLSIPGASHAEAQSTDPDLYWSTVDAFIENYIP